MTERGVGQPPPPPAAEPAEPQVTKAKGDMKLLYGFIVVVVILLFASAAGKTEFTGEVTSFDAIDEANLSVVLELSNETNGRLLN